MTRPSNVPLSVLLVASDLAYVRAVRDALDGARSHQWSVEHVGGLQAAIDLLGSGTFDALLLDLDLPEAQGLEALRRLTTRFTALPVVVLIGWEAEAVGLEALQHGAQDYIVKQEEERRLAKALRFAVERKRALDTVRQLEKAVDTMQLGISITDPGGRIIYVNGAEAALHGYEPEAMLGIDARSLSPRAEWRTPDQEEMAGFQTWKRERVRSRRDGTTFPVQLMSDVVKDEGGRALGVVTTCEDITERKRAEHALRESEERYALAVRGANDGIWDWSLKDDRLYVSSRWKQMLGYQEDELGLSSEEWFSRIHPEDLPRVRRKIQAHLDGTSPHFEDEHRVRHRSGRYLWVLTRGFALRGDDGAATRMAGAQTDVTDRRAHDALTGLPNRALMTERLEQALARWQRRAEDGFAVLFVDLDSFKAVNDTLGHAAGDALLMEVAARLERCLRPGDVVGRLAGDEFGVLLDRIRDVDPAVEVAERIQHELHQPLSWDGYPLRLSASIGIAISATGYESAEQILREADAAMYRAKAAGRGRFEIFDAAMRERLRTRQRLEQGVRQAKGGEDLRLLFQPIVALADGRLLGFEALLRWEHPDGRWLTPPEVLALAEQTGQSPRIEAWTLREASRQAVRWRDLAGRPLALAVNVSWAQCRRADLADEIHAILAEHGLPPELLWLDVGERCVTDAATGKALARLRETGVRLFLDDFGAGESPLAPLARAALDAVKLDASVVHTADRAGGAPLLAAIMSVARSLQLPVVAEGVESAAQRARLVDLGCALAQGVLFAAPLPAEEAAARAAEAGAAGADSHAPWSFGAGQAAPPKPPDPPRRTRRALTARRTTGTRRK